jgi:hypothetical protein
LQFKLEIFFFKQGTTVTSLKSSGLASQKALSSASLGADATNAQVSVTTSTPTAGQSEVLPTLTEEISSQGESHILKHVRWDMNISRSETSSTGDGATTTSFGQEMTTAAATSSEASTNATAVSSSLDTMTTATSTSTTTTPMVTTTVTTTTVSVCQKNLDE